MKIQNTVQRECIVTLNNVELILIEKKIIFFLINNYIKEEIKIE